MVRGNRILVLLGRLLLVGTSFMLGFFLLLLLLLLFNHRKEEEKVTLLQERKQMLTVCVIRIVKFGN